MTRRFSLFVVSLAILWAPAVVAAQYSGAFGLSGLPSMSSFFGQGNSQTSMPFASVIPSHEGNYLKLGLRKYINSFTSKQFPSDPSSSDRFDPESRLEFPWQQTLGVIKLSRVFYGMEVNFEGASTLFVSSEPMIQDSDWTDPTNPSQKTIFSVECRDFLSEIR
jgi:hypothetical protein